MEKVINITDAVFDMERFEDAEALKKFYESYDLDGLEILFVGEDELELDEKFSKSNIVGMHLSGIPYWIDLWHGDLEAVDKEFGSREFWQSKYKGVDGSALVRKLKRDVDFAQKIGAKYTVFHIGEVSLRESQTYEFYHTDEEVVDAACEIINEVLDNGDYTFDFLCENLWWPGLNFKDPAITKRLMDGIHYKNKGIIFDMGHYLHTNTELKTEDEAVDYICETLDAHKDLLHHIKGVHLHQTLSGEYVKGILANVPEEEAEYAKRYTTALMHIYYIDNHLPFLNSRLVDVLNNMDIKYLNYELITCSMEEHIEKLDKQLAAVPVKLLK